MVTIISDNFQGLISTLQRLNEIPEPQLSVKYPRTPGYRSEDDAW